MSVEIKRTNPNGIMDLIEKLKKRTKQEIAVGFPKEKQEAYPNGTTVLDVAVANNFGTDTIPERNFMEMARPEVIKKTEPILKALARLDPEDDAQINALQEAAGMLGQEEIRKAIIELDSPPNAPATIKAKGSSNPLIDTGHMKDSVTFVVRDRTK